jgi:hypothetical protein
VARRLRDAAAAADTVVLHTDGDDVVPMLAFAARPGGQRVLLLDHADHAFWLGSSISDLVVALRRSGLRLARRRRSIAPERSVLLPIVVDPVERELPRDVARRSLDLPQDAVVVLSVARGVKYRSFEGVGFVASLLPVLQQHPQAVVLAVGPDGGGEWDEASRLTGGRIKAVGPRDDAGPYFQAADVYVDSSPISSTTSLLEAGSYGLPLVTRPLVSADAGVLCVDSPGLDETMFTCRDLESFRSVVSHLIEDRAHRVETGEQTRCAIRRLHSGDSWRLALERLYGRVSTVAPASDLPVADRPEVAEVDVAWSRIFRSEHGLDQALARVAWGLPLDLRLRWFLDTARRGERVPPSMLLPRTSTLRVRDALVGLRRFDRHLRHGATG